MAPSTAGAAARRRILNAPVPPAGGGARDGNTKCRRARDDESRRSLALVCVAGALYLAATFAWIWLLRTAPLSRAYPYMALSFVLVPLMSAFFFRESLSAQYVIGIALVIAGIVVATLDSSA